MSVLLESRVNKVRKNFSRAARLYDQFSGLHRDIGRELMAHLPTVAPGGRILDIGMGTGWLTRELLRNFPGARVIGLDLSEGMIAMAKGQNSGSRFLQADAAALPFKTDVFDLIVSNLAYQWVEDLESSLRRCYALLKPRGSFCVTLFGRETLKELFLSLEHAQEGGLPTRRRLAGYPQVAEAVQRSGFADAVLSCTRRNIPFTDMFALLRWLKAIGANTLGREMFMSKEYLAAANDYYQAHYREERGVSVSFEVIGVSARKG